MRTRRGMDRRNTIEVTADKALHTGSSIGKPLAITSDGAGEDVVDHHRRDGGDQADGGGEQRFGAAGRDDAPPCAAAPV